MSPAAAPLHAFGFILLIRKKPKPTCCRGRPRSARLQGTREAADSTALQACLAQEDLKSPVRYPSKKPARLNSTSTGSFAKESVSLVDPLDYYCNSRDGIWHATGKCYQNGVSKHRALTFQSRFRIFLPRNNLIWQLSVSEHEKDPLNSTANGDIGT